MSIRFSKGIGFKVGRMDVPVVARRYRSISFGLGIGRVCFSWWAT